MDELDRRIAAQTGARTAKRPSAPIKSGIDRLRAARRKLMDALRAELAGKTPRKIIVEAADGPGLDILIGILLADGSSFKRENLLHIECRWPSHPKRPRHAVSIEAHLVHPTQCKRTRRLYDGAANEDLPQIGAAFADLVLDLLAEKMLHGWRLDAESPAASTRIGSPPSSPAAESA